jgi:hypothetical protein
MIDGYSMLVMAGVFFFVLELFIYMRILGEGIIVVFLGNHVRVVRIL